MVFVVAQLLDDRTEELRFDLPNNSEFEIVRAEQPAPSATAPERSPRGRLALERDARGTRLLVQHPSISAHHATLELSDEHVVHIQDHESTNGTFARCLGTSGLGSPAREVLLAQHLLVRVLGARDELAAQLENCEDTAEFEAVLSQWLTKLGVLASAADGARVLRHRLARRPGHIEIRLQAGTDNPDLVDEIDRLVARFNRREGAAILGEITAASEKRREAVALARRVAPSQRGVLLLGGTGVGKEGFARLIHAASTSPRARRPFVAVNCGAIPENLMESELFGHEKGAFTGAAGRKYGLFREADGGTLFLDEVENIPLALQPKLLRVLQELRVRPVGGTQELPVDVRIVAATNRNLTQMVEDKTFRDDLYYRLAVITIEIPLEPEDIRAIAWETMASEQPHSQRRIDDDEVDRIAVLAFSNANAFRGGARQLVHTIERYLVLRWDGQEPVDLCWRRALGAPTAPSLAAPSLEKRRFEDVKQAFARALLLRAALDAPTVSSIADRVGTTRQTVDQRLREMGVHLSERERLAALLGEARAILKSAGITLEERP